MRNSNSEAERQERAWSSRGTEGRPAGLERGEGVRAVGVGGSCPPRGLLAALSPSESPCSSPKCAPPAPRTHPHFAESSPSAQRKREGILFAVGRHSDVGTHHGSCPQQDGMGERLLSDGNRGVCLLAEARRLQGPDTELELLPPQAHPAAACGKSQIQQILASSPLRSPFPIFCPLSLLVPQGVHLDLVSRLFPLHDLNLSLAAALLNN